MSIDQWLGLIMTGILLGCLLQKGRVLRFEKQIVALLLKDMTIVKFMLSAILVGMVGITLLTDTGLGTLSHKPMNLGAVLLGGALFGAGWAVMGYCPGTSIGALGEGRWHAVFAVVGMLIGAALSMRNSIPSSNQRFWHGMISERSACRRCWVCQRGSSFRCSGPEPFPCSVLIRLSHTTSICSMLSVCTNARRS